MKARKIGALLLVLGVAAGLIGYAASAAQGKPVSPLQGGDALRWHVVTNPGDSSKTFLVDSLVGETYIFSSSGDSYSWKKMEKGK